MPNYDSVIQLIVPEIEFHQNRYARGLGEVLAPDCRWLDIGAGTMVHRGWIGPTERELVTRARSVIGCDVVVDHLRRNASLSASVGADARHLPFADGSFDLVTANMVLEHLVEPRGVFDEIARILAPGGRFIFVTPNRTNPVVWLASKLLTRTERKALSRVLESRASEHIFYTFYRANSPREIRRLIADSALRPRCLEQFSSYPFIRRPWVLTLLETLWIRAIERQPLRGFRSNLFGDLEKVGNLASPLTS
jgi:SAM-dependent methyltransferase